MDGRDRDSAGRAHNARPRDALGRPLPRGSPGVDRVPEDVTLSPEEALRQAQRFLDEGLPFHAHEVFEVVWKATAGEHRELWRGLAQLAVGLTHLQRGNPKGAVALLRRAADRIAPYSTAPPHNLNLATLIAQARSLAARIESQRQVEPFGGVRELGTAKWSLLGVGRGERLRIGMQLSYSGGFQETVAELAEYEKAGLEIVFVPEAYSFDAVSQLGFIAARTERLEIASGILQIYTRTPALTAMTAAGLDYVSGGRFTLGIGASGPQVVEGFHGVPYTAPLGRTRELVEICRAVWRRERLEYQGRHYQIPLPAEHGTGLGKPLKLINHPVRERIPIVIAAIGPKNVALAAEIAEGWQPMFYVPEQAAEVWGDSLAAGRAKRNLSLGDLDVIISAPLALTDDDQVAEGLLAATRPMLALYIGGMGAKGRNFYHDLACRLGFQAEAEEIQDRFLAGNRAAAAAAVPDELVRRSSLIGPAGYVRDRLALLRASGVTTLNVTPMAGSTADRVRLIEQIRDFADDL